MVIYSLKCAHIRRLAIGVMIVCAMTSSKSYADFVNGSFETGTLSGWSSLGTVSVQSQQIIGLVPTDRKYQAYLVNEDANGNGVSSSVLEPFINVPSGSLDNVVSGIAIQGSAMKQTLTVNSGDTLSFDWNFLTSADNLNSGLDDYAFVSISTVGVFLLADTNSAFNPSTSYVFDSETGYHNFTTVIPTSGTYTIAFGVVDVYSSTVPSGLAIDNAQLTRSVPEPTSMIPLGIGMVTLAGYSRYRSRKSSD